MIIIKKQLEFFGNIVPTVNDDGIKSTGQTGHNGTKNYEIMVPLKIIYIYMYI